MHYLQIYSKNLSHGIDIPLELAENSSLSFGFQVQLFLCLWNLTHIALKSEYTTESNQLIERKEIRIYKLLYDKEIQGSCSYFIVTWNLWE